jgi:tyrosyl-tRNA synthetase
MLSFDSVKLRLEREQPLSFLEFNYMILQAYDFVHLNKSHSCKLQLGGSEQWGNIVSGIDLCKKLENQSVFGLTTPIITKSDGTKMGKTAGGAVWLNEDMLSPYDFWQFWRNVADADVNKFLKIYTEIPLSDIETISNVTGRKMNDAKIVLADSVTELCHGKNAAKNAKSVSQKMFNAPSHENISAEEHDCIPISKAEMPIYLSKLLVKLELSKSNNSAKKLIEGGGIKINGLKIQSIDYEITHDVFNKTNRVKLSIGKKKHVMLSISND